MNVCVLGASNKPERYAYKAIERLKEAGYKVFPVHPKLQEVQDIQVFNSLSAIKEKIHTITLYVSAAKSQLLATEILDLKPERIIFNPGAENEELMALALNNGIKAMDACTLVLLSTRQF